jgi:hypothetical protein
MSNVEPRESHAPMVAGACHENPGGLAVHSAEVKSGDKIFIRTTTGPRAIGFMARSAPGRIEIVFANGTL